MERFTMRRPYQWDGNPETEPKYTAEELEEMAELAADNWRDKEPPFDTLKDEDNN
jgi:hypothetical protein